MQKIISFINSLTTPVAALVEGQEYELNTTGATYTAAFQYTPEEQANYEYHQLGTNKPLWCLEAVDEDTAPVVAYTNIHGLTDYIQAHSIQLCANGSLWVAACTVNGDTHAPLEWSARDLRPVLANL